MGLGGGRDASCRGGGGATYGGALLGSEAPLLLPVLEAANEARVGFDAGSLALYKVEGGVVGHVVGVDQIGDDHCGRARHALEDAERRGRRTAQRQIA